MLIYQISHIGLQPDGAVLLSLPDAFPGQAAMAQVDALVWKTGSVSAHSMKAARKSTVKPHYSLLPL
jgi:hypothetical protein